MVLPLPLLFLFSWPIFAIAQSSTPLPPSALPGTSFASLTSATSSVSTATNATASGSLTASPTSSTAFPSLSGYSPCVVTCLELSISQVNCDSTVDVNCYCNNATLFTSALVGCMNSSCPSGDLANAEGLSQLFCNVASSSVSLSFSSLPTSSNASSSSLPTSSSSSTSTSSGSTSAASSGSSSSPSATPSPSGQANQTSGAEVAYQSLLGPKGALVAGVGLTLLGMVLG